MKVVHTIAEVRAAVRAARQAGQRVGFVPTMGYLHEGHLALVAAARRDNDLVVVSIFVNPLQFGPHEDYERYPRDLARDTALLREAGCDILFAPSVEEMYPQPMATVVELPELSRPLCGRSRPTHFRGVSTVVCKLFHIVEPDRAYFGQKDGQQLAIIRRMVADLNMPVEVVAIPTVREPDGLAKSSRNVYLTPEERPHATVLYRALMWAKARIDAGERDAAQVAAGMRAMIEAEPMVRLDYAEVVDMATLQPLARIQGDVMLAVAAYVGKARLIDNLPLTIS
ncbi:pantothenate synthetase [Alicyclobacillus cellulosilyticus]|uniref:Pantothenate synthetase n=1 Tax=Alicyclobacillus cellulosilyticus TaxID=1003997 RepID=A0A917K9B1_9BACL|nr:pantoate--beta-alanine ligase [Alicyclobacillus cellulosilyticus]GGJ05038.1 pantothenate synthetase [Alicyclobacillus cellulosilyticus]